MELFKVAFHIDEVSKWNLTLVNVRNFVEDIGDAEYFIEIVANAEAVKIFTDNSVQNIAKILEKMEFLVKYKVKISFCRNALRANNIAEDKLPVFINLVNAGVTQIVILQRRGYCYIKP